jgi:hypothetical protein
MAADILSEVLISWAVFRSSVVGLYDIVFIPRYGMRMLPVLMREGAGDGERGRRPKASELA